jgi:hypothetical protein
LDSVNGSHPMRKFLAPAMVGFVSRLIFPNGSGALSLDQLEVVKHQLQEEYGLKLSCCTSAGKFHSDYESVCGGSPNTATTAGILQYFQELFLTTSSKNTRTPSKSVRGTETKTLLDSSLKLAPAVGALAGVDRQLGPNNTSLYPASKVAALGRGSSVLKHCPASCAKHPSGDAGEKGSIQVIELLAGEEDLVQGLELLGSVCAHEVGHEVVDSSPGPRPKRRRLREDNDAADPLLEASNEERADTSTETCGRGRVARAIPNNGLLKFRSSVAEDAPWLLEEAKEFAKKGSYIVFTPGDRRGYKVLFYDQRLFDGSTNTNTNAMEANDQTTALTLQHMTNSARKQKLFALQRLLEKEACDVIDGFKELHKEKKIYASEVSIIWCGTNDQLFHTDLTKLSEFQQNKEWNSVGFLVSSVLYPLTGDGSNLKVMYPSGAIDLVHVLRGEALFFSGSVAHAGGTHTGPAYRLHVHFEVTGDVLPLGRARDHVAPPNLLHEQLRVGQKNAVTSNAIGILDQEQELFTDHLTRNPAFGALDPDQLIIGMVPVGAMQSFLSAKDEVLGKPPFSISKTIGVNKKFTSIGSKGFLFHFRVGDALATKIKEEHAVRKFLDRIARVTPMWCRGEPLVVVSFRVTRDEKLQQHQWDADGSSHSLLQGSEKKLQHLFSLHIPLTSSKDMELDLRPDASAVSKKVPVVLRAKIPFGVYAALHADVPYSGCQVQAGNVSMQLSFYAERKAEQVPKTSPGVKQNHFIQIPMVAMKAHPLLYLDDGVRKLKKKWSRDLKTALQR